MGEPHEVTATIIVATECDRMVEKSDRQRSQIMVNCSAICNDAMKVFIAGKMKKRKNTCESVLII